jgi:hypothetical protein
LELYSKRQISSLCCWVRCEKKINLEFTLEERS